MKRGFFNAEGRWGVQAVEAQYPADEGGWAGALALGFRCSDEWSILSVLIRRDRFATRDPGFFGATRWTVTR